MKLGCTRCGASVVFVPSTGKCHCNHCDEDIDPDEFANLSERVQYQECTCSSCGAKLVVEESTKITVCAYCGSKYFHLSNYKGDIKVDGIIPFEIDREEFQRRADDFIISQKLSPQSFRYSIPLSEVKGIYLLAKEFKTDSIAYARGTNGDSVHFFECRYDVKNTYLRDNSISFSDTVFKEIGPYPTEELRKFSPFYLTDFSIDQGNEDEEFIIGTIKQKEGNMIEKEFNQVLYEKENAVQKEGIRTSNTTIEEQRNILIPVWLFTVKYEGYIFTYAMNGKTGKIYGSYPKNYDDEKTQNEESMKMMTIFCIAFFAFPIIAIIHPAFAGLGFGALFALMITIMIYQPFKSFMMKRKKGSAAPLSLMKLFKLVFISLIVLYFLTAIFKLPEELYAIMCFLSPIIIDLVLFFMPAPKRKIYMEKETRSIHHVNFHAIDSASEYTKHFQSRELVSLKSKMNADEKEFAEIVKNNQVGI